MGAGQPEDRAERARLGPGLRAQEPRAPLELCERLGVRIPDETLTECLTHRSYAYEHGGLTPNERLEFLGDAVLGLVVTDALFRRNPEAPEGQLARMRAAVVNTRTLADVARALNLGAYLRLGRGEANQGGRDKTSILADALEALFGAVYVGCGMDRATRIVHDLMAPAIDASESLGAGLDWKTSLQELSSQLGLGVPRYVVSATGPDHQRVFTASVQLSDGMHGGGAGPTKKEAEQHAARQTHEELTVSAAEPAGADPSGARPVGGDGAPRPQGD